MESPAWLKKALFYEIYPQSFYDSNGDGIGDLEGITEKLDYIKELGCNALWLNPIFESPFYDAGYDVSDYKKVAPRYGSNEDAYRLFEEAHKRGMHVLLDLVAGHTSIEHPWFKASCKAEENEFSDRYIWTNWAFQPPKNQNYLSGISERDGCVVLNFFSIQPALNYGYYEIDDPSYETSYLDEPARKTREAMEDVILFWLGHGCDGFRVDMAGSLVKNDPEQKGTEEVWRRIFASVKPKYPESAFVSEWSCPERALNCGFDMDFVLQGYWQPLHQKLTRGERPYFSFQEGKKDSDPTFEQLKGEVEFAESHHRYLCMISGNHDIPRLARSLTQEETRLYLAFEYSFSGVPFLYYGDEIGMKFEENIPSVEGGYKERTGTRSPMQWDASKMAGFTTSSHSYIPINPDRKGISVEEEEKDPASLLNYLKVLLKFRKEHAAFDADASFAFLSYEEGKPLVYVREKDGEKIVCAFNLTEEEASISLPEAKGEILFGNGAKFEEGELKLPKHCFAFVR